MTGAREESSQVVPFKPRERPPEEDASSRWKVAFLERVREIWGVQYLEDAAQRLEPRLEARVLTRWHRRLAFAGSWEEVFSEAAVRLPFTSRIEDVLAWAARGEGWTLLLEIPRGLGRQRTAAVLRREAPWTADLKRLDRLVNQLWAQGWVLFATLSPSRVLGLFELTTPETLTAKLFDERGTVVRSSRTLGKPP